LENGHAAEEESQGSDDPIKKVLPMLGVVAREQLNIQP
jgi:hypothetical protein